MERATGNELAERRAQLQRRADAQRRLLGAIVDSIDERLGSADRGLNTAKRFVQRPALLAGAAVLGLLVGPRRFAKLAGQGVLLAAAARRLLRHVRL